MKKTKYKTRFELPKSIEPSKATHKIVYLIGQNQYDCFFGNKQDCIDVCDWALNHAYEGFYIVKKNKDFKDYNLCKDCERKNLDPCVDSWGLLDIKTKKLLQERIDNGEESSRILCSPGNKTECEYYMNLSSGR